MKETQKPNKAGNDNDDDDYTGDDDTGRRLSPVKVLKELGIVVANATL